MGHSGWYLNVYVAIRNLILFSSTSFESVLGSAWLFGPLDPSARRARGWSGGPSVFCMYRL